MFKYLKHFIGCFFGLNTTVFDLLNLNTTYKKIRGLLYIFRVLLHIFNDGKPVLYYVLDK